VLVALTAIWIACLLPLPSRPSSWLVTLSGVPLLLIGSGLWPRAADEAWSAFARRTLDYHALAAVLLFAFGVQFEDAHGVTTDGVIYFSQLRSLLFDGDLNVAKEFEYLGQPPRPYHVVPIGPTIVWLPLYLIVAGIDFIGRHAGFWPEPDDPIAVGLTLPYVRAALVSSFAIGTIGLIEVHRYLRGGFERGVAFATSALILGATPLVWYMVYEPSMTHAASFGFVALFVTIAVRRTSPRIRARDAMVLGALLGLAFISRPQEAVFAIVPALLLLTASEPWPVRLRAAVRLAAWAFLGAAPFLALQGVHSAILFSRENFSVVGSNGYLDLLHSRWADTLWSSWHGFLSWTPIAYVALVGTVAYAARAWRWTIAAIATVLVMAWINGSAADWNAGWSFGGRRFVSCLVVLAPGLAFVIQQLLARPTVVLGVLAAAAIGWNQLLMAQYAGNLLPGAEPASFGRIVRQQATVLTRPPFFYPFAFPANAWFAWRNGLPIDRYDLLAPEPLKPAVDVAFDTNANKYLIDGWGARGSDSTGELRWLDASHAELVLPLDPPRDAPVTIAITARTRLLDPPVQAPIKVSINGRRIGELAAEAERPSVSTLTVPAGSDVWIRGFNRFVFDKSAESEAPPPVAFYRLAVR